MSLKNWRDNGWLAEQQFDKFRKKRNIGGYEAAGRISQQEADEMKALAKKLREQVGEWLQYKYPELLERNKIDK